MSEMSGIGIHDKTRRHSSTTRREKQTRAAAPFLLDRDRLNFVGRF